MILISVSSLVGNPPDWSLANQDFGFGEWKTVIYIARKTTPKTLRKWLRVLARDGNQLSSFFKSCEYSSTSNLSVSSESESEVVGADGRMLALVMIAIPDLLVPLLDEMLLSVNGVIKCFIVNNNIG